MNSFLNVKFFWEVFVTLLVITDPAGHRAGHGAGLRRHDGRPSGG
jgi:hypothetical protein